MDYVLDPMLPPRRFTPRSRFERPGIAPEHERWFNLALAALVFVFAAAWSYAVYQAFAHGTTPPMLSRAVTANPLSPGAPPPAAYLVDAAMRSFATRDLRGASGAVNIVVRRTGEGIAVDSLPAGAAVRYGTASDSLGTTSPPSRG